MVITLETEGPCLIFWTVFQLFKLAFKLQKSDQPSQAKPVCDAMCPLFLFTITSKIDKVPSQFRWENHVLSASLSSHTSCFWSWTVVLLILMPPAEVYSILLYVFIGMWQQTCAIDKEQVLQLKRFSRSFYYYSLSWTLMKNWFGPFNTSSLLNLKQAKFTISHLSPAQIFTFTQILLRVL